MASPTVVTAAAFVAAFPEFTNAPTAVVEDRLCMAERRTLVDVWGDLQSDGICYLAAHLLAASPQGQRLRGGDTETLYMTERKRLEGIVASGFRTAGEP